ncbi:MAG: hypothetical protein RLZZ546_181 [Bacteroidota bacterium]|jgi:DNA-binding NarL/FixJ family response regulator
MFKIAIYEDNNQLRSNLCTLLLSQDDFELVGEYDNCVEIIENCKSNCPDVIIMDIDMPKMTGIEGVKLVKSQFQKVEVIMYTVFEDTDRIFEAILAGATGYILKDTASEVFCNSIREVMNGGSPMTPSIARKVLLQYGKPKVSQEIELLSSREMEILTELSKGLSYKMIASQLFISVETVRSHCKKIYSKLHVRSVTEALNKIYLR